MKYIVGAYVSSPSLLQWDQQAEEEYLAGIRDLNNVRGLELPFYKTIHPHDKKWFLKNLVKEWDYVITCVPGMMEQLKKDPEFGLASDSETGRKKAVDFMKLVQAELEVLHKKTKRKSVIAVQMITAPNLLHSKEGSSIPALVKSLREIKRWNWQDAQLVIEHCDAYIENQAGCKAFMSLDDEIKALKQCNKIGNQPIGITINWGRSAIELRSASAVLEHIRQAIESGLLTGLVFSGATNKDKLYGSWQDNHMPPPQEQDNSWYAENSLMTAKQIKNSLLEAEYDDLLYIGTKIMTLPKDASMEQRIGVNADTLNLLDNIIEEIEDY